MRCEACKISDPVKALEHIDMKWIKDYGDMAYGHCLHTWDDGQRYLVKCIKCGGYILVQKSEFHGYDHDDYYKDYFFVDGEEEAEELNQKYDGFQLENSGIQYLIVDGKDRTVWRYFAHKEIAGDKRDCISKLKKLKVEIFKIITKLYNFMKSLKAHQFKKGKIISASIKSSDQAFFDLPLLDDSTESDNVNNLIKGSSANYNNNIDSNNLDNNISIETEYEDKESIEYYNKMMANIALPESIKEVIDTEYDKGIESLSKYYDGIRGDSTRIRSLQIVGDITADSAVEAIVNWKKNVHIMYETKNKSLFADENLYYKYCETLLSYKYNRTILILVDKLPPLSVESIRMCYANDITFGYILKEQLGYYDLLKKCSYILTYESYPGSADDAATYLYCSWMQVKS